MSPELHLFAVDDLLAEQDAHIPAWLPAEINLSPRRMKPSETARGSQ